jgi:hypothetical protein
LHQNLKIMRSILFILVLFPVLMFSQAKNCVYDFEEKTDSTFVKVMPEKLIYERVFGNAKDFIQFTLINNNGVPTLFFQLLQKNNGFITASCLDKKSRIVFQLANGKIVTLLSATDEVCSTLTFNDVAKENIRILDGYFLFSKDNYEELKKSPITLMRVQFSSETKDFVIKKEIKSEVLKQTYTPENYFINYLHCVE